LKKLPEFVVLDEFWFELELFDEEVEDELELDDVF